MGVGAILTIGVIVGGMFLFRPSLEHTLGNLLPSWLPQSGVKLDSNSDDSWKHSVASMRHSLDADDRKKFDAILDEIEGVEWMTEYAPLRDAFCNQHGISRAGIPGAEDAQFQNQARQKGYAEMQEILNGKTWPEILEIGQQYYPKLQAAYDDLHRR
jgi:hypothetical protein